MYNEHIETNLEEVRMNTQNLNALITDILEKIEEHKESNSANQLSCIIAPDGFDGFDGFTIDDLARELHKRNISFKIVYHQSTYEYPDDYYILTIYSPVKP